jgi:mRNA-degrading endonuclease RelE of RelBE toxin-antitoxin system
MKVLLHRSADKYLGRLNVTDRDRIEDGIEGLEKEPPEGDIERIKGQRGTFRLKIGSSKR